MHSLQRDSPSFTHSLQLHQTSSRADKLQHELRVAVDQSNRHITLHSQAVSDASEAISKRMDIQREVRSVPLLPPRAALHPPGCA